MTTSEKDWLSSPPDTLIRQLLALREAVEHPSAATANWPKYAISDRKLRLIGCGMCRWVWHLLPHPRAGMIVTLAELRADGDNGPRGSVHAVEMSDWALREMVERTSHGVARNHAVHWCLSDHLLPLPGQVMGWLWPDLQPTAAIQVIHDIAGNPFRPVAFSPGWRTPDVVNLAENAYQNRDEVGHLHPDMLAALSDALEEAGCSEQGILDHLREECASNRGGIDYHVRGCWALDAVLDKS